MCGGCRYDPSTWLPPELPLRLADFIETHADPILSEWVDFAHSCGPAGSTMDVEGLRDHAVEMLQNIIVDLRTPQTDAEQSEKAKGNALSADDGTDTAAEVHGAGRAMDGFTIGEMVAEYRALRASVLRLWTQECGELSRDEQFDDLMRFNEAIDQALAESITRYTEDIDRSKEMFVAILGHDLRTPLGAVVMAAQFMMDTGELGELHLTLTRRILHSSRRMNSMVGELLDFTRSRLGSGMPIVRSEMDLAKEAAHAIDEAAAAHPESVLELTTTGNLRGKWDCPRISQVMQNLIGNAIQHGTPKSPITMTVIGEAEEVVLRVHNRGPTIPRQAIHGIFGPFKRLGTANTHTTSLGLGLYIAERIVTAHGGTIDVTSSESDGTTFTVRLPRAPRVNRLPPQDAQPQEAAHTPSAAGAASHPA